MGMYRAQEKEAPMATRLRSTHSCAICGCDDVILDYVSEEVSEEVLEEVLEEEVLEEEVLEQEVLEQEVLGPERAFALALSECPRCEHRWTRSLQLPTRREARQAAVVRVLRTASEAVPTAA